MSGRYTSDLEPAMNEMHDRTEIYCIWFVFIHLAHIFFIQGDLEM